MTVRKREPLCAARITAKEDPFAYTPCRRSNAIHKLFMQVQGSTNHNCNTTLVESLSTAAAL